MLFEVEICTVPHIKAPGNAKVGLGGLKCGGTFIYRVRNWNVKCLGKADFSFNNDLETPKLKYRHCPNPI